MSITGAFLILVGFTIGIPVGIFADRSWQIKANIRQYNRLSRRMDKEDRDG